MELLGLLRQAGGKRVAPDARRLIDAGARDDEGPRHRRVAHDLVDGIGLTRQQALVDLQALGRQDGAVDDQLVTRGQDDDVVEHDGIGAHREIDSVAADHRLRLADHRELRKGP
ncbi:unannotated protein [freshwater metagenome]|uniref:Unannotated protein n=1 Tax=freshwater metagenome TaxID=449393 RepID=A0A6J7ER11_9ZZZZ